MSVGLWMMTGAAAASLALSLLLTALAIRLAPRIGFVDRPGGHKSHFSPTPYGGGTAIFLSVFAPIAALLIGAYVLPEQTIARWFGESAVAYAGGVAIRLKMALVVIAGGLALHVMGLIDDVRPLGPYVKLLALLAVGIALAIIGDIRLAQFAGYGPSVALTVVWFVVITNAFNFLDNMDGLSAGVATICMSFLAICGVLAGQVFVPLLACLFVGAAAGFLVFNFPPARIFMGDAGSLFCGYMLVVVSILTTYYEGGRAASPAAVVMPLVILAVPLYDFISVILIRISEGRNPMRGDQRHFSHRLVERGLTRRFAVLTIYLATATTGLAATLLPNATAAQTVTIAAIVLMVLAIVAILESPVRREA
ncbi:MAG: undecaprenyl/decaprenyl-phosphate alpha-N-acetylglucosaminyl 1-phosphate transferase [Phycisphaerales bacterium]|nr:undecaprenyl/decaprenyl-phosphate alpha-N-acetylglucosaminyl 1-phosphate transferase [Phycisphaerales bacterium]